MEVSVIIPTYDRPQQLQQACQSVFRQTIKPQEIIIIDDGSQVSIDRLSLEQICPPEINIKIERFDSSQGACIARNLGAEIASGDILMFLDDDDTWSQDKIANQVQILTHHPEVGLVYAGRKVVNEQGQLLFTITPKLQGKIYSELLTSNHIGVTSSVAIRKQVFFASKGFDPQMPGRQDYDLWIRIAQITTIEFDPQLTVNWTLHSQPGKQMNSRPELYEQAVRRFLTKYRQDLEKLSWIEQRKAYASQYRILADKYSQIGSWRQYWYVFRSLLQYPSLSALARLLPYSLYLQLRKLKLNAR